MGTKHPRLLQSLEAGAQAKDDEVATRMECTRCNVSALHGHGNQGSPAY